MESPAPILVTGASGTVGHTVVRILEEASVPVRLAARRTSPSATSEAVTLDFTDPGTWDRAFTGVEAMLLVRPPQLGRVQTQILPALERARARGVQRVVFLSVLGADRIRVIPHAVIERWLKSSGLAWTFVRAAYFMQNLTGVHREDIALRNEIALPVGGGRMSLVDAEDVAGVAAAALLDPASHERRAWTPTGPAALDLDQVAAILSDVLGRRIRYSRPRLLRYVGAARRTGQPGGLVAVTATMYTAARLGLSAGRTDDVETVLGRPATTFADFARRERAAWTN